MLDIAQSGMAVFSLFVPVSDRVSGSFLLKVARIAFALSTTFVFLEGEKYSDRRESLVIRKDSQSGLSAKYCSTQRAIQASLNPLSVPLSKGGIFWIARE